MHKVFGIVQPPLADGICNAEPRFADKNQQNLTLSDGILDYGAEVGPRCNGVNVHKDTLGSKVCSEPIIQATGVPSTVISTATDKEMPHRICLLMQFYEVSAASTICEPIKY